MKIYNNQEEVEKDVVDWVLKIKDDIKFTFNLEMNIDIVAYNIHSKNIDVNNIDAINIYVNDIKAYNINCNDIKANNINCNDIKAININANNITYYGICIAYKTFKYKSIKSIIKEMKNLINK